MDNVGAAEGRTDEGERGEERNGKMVAAAVALPGGREQPTRSGTGEGGRTDDSGSKS